ncbi:O-acyltransferase WSD1-like [Quillaja saponaria]|uniref:O-acyltransferase WSD1-like n=1 Tax=Quillaja saponaria TaxID=32244 RepID=A0AAD7PLC7_QUISA|nr:O-acyltransferase WSD1-like [Quillaja saponaria]
MSTSIAAELERETLLKHPRFSCKLGKKNRTVFWTPTTVNLDHHVTVPEIDSKTINFPDKYVEDYISNMTTTPLDLSKPLWELHLLNIKTSEAESVGIFRIHHSIGDGASLISLLLACTRKASDPEALPTVPKFRKKRSASGSSSNYSNMFCWVFLCIWSGLMFVFNTLVDTILFVGTILFLKDTKSPLKGELGVENNTKRFIHRTVSLDDIKLVKDAMNMTINDVLLGITQAALSRYLNRKYGEDENGGKSKEKASNLPKSIRLRASITANVRTTAGIQDLADMMAKKSKTTRWAIIDRKKQSLESHFTFACATLILQLFGPKIAAGLTRRVLFNTTLTFSNVVGPKEEISFFGHPIAYVAPSLYGLSQALVIHYQSYVNKMTIIMAIDPNVILDPHCLCDDLEESLQLIRNAVTKKGLPADVV